MIDFNKLPITIWQPSQVDLTNLPSLSDGIHYFINVDLTQKTYDEIHNNIREILHQGMNLRQHEGAGSKCPIQYSSNIHKIINDCYINNQIVDELTKHGFNPILLKPQYKNELYIWGNQFVWKNKPYPFINTLDPSFSQDWHPSNLILFAQKFHAILDNDLSDEIQELEQKRNELLEQVHSLDQQLEIFRSNKFMRDKP